MLVFTALCVVFSCCSSPSNTSEEAGTAVETKPQIKDNSTSKQSFWTFAKDEVPLTKSELKKIRNAYRNFSQKSNELKKQGKWKGKENKKARQRLEKARKAQVRKILSPEKFASFEAADKKWSKKS